MTTRCQSHSWIGNVRVCVCGLVLEKRRIADGEGWKEEVDSPRFSLGVCKGGLISGLIEFEVFSVDFTS